MKRAALFAFALALTGCLGSTAPTGPRVESPLDRGEHFHSLIEQPLRPQAESEVRVASLEEAQP